MAAILGSKWSTSKRADSHVAFGSKEERKMFPVHTNPSRMGIEQGIRGDPFRGPGCYDDDPVNLFLQPINTRPRSLRGCGFGATLANSRPSVVLAQGKDFPGPGHYQSISKTGEDSAFKPFLSAALRFKEDSGTWDHLGPGSHEHNVPTDRRIEFHESFGGRRVLRKSIVTKCTQGIPDKCSKCRQVPLGDYYENNNHALCRHCYQLVRGEQGGGAGPNSLRGMRKVRDCTGIHKHDFPGTAPKTIIMPEKEQKKLQYREAYMSLYYN